MKKLFLWSLILLSAASYGQSLETPARTKIQALRGVPLLQFPNYSLTNALTDLADLSTRRIPFMTLAQFRAGAADSTRAILITDTAIKGIFYYTSGSAAADNGTSVLVYGERRYIKDLSVQTSITALSATTADSIAVKASKTALTALQTTLVNSIATKADNAATTTALNAKAPLSSPVFTGTPSFPTGTTVVTQTAGNNTTAPASTAFVTGAVAGKVGTTGDETIAGIKTFSTTANYRGTWSSVQALFGSTGQAGRIAFGRSSDGSAQVRLGYSSAAENNKWEISNNAGSGTVGLATVAGTGVQVFPSGRVRTQIGGTYTDSGEQLQVGGNLKVEGTSTTTGTATVGALATTGAANVGTLTVEGAVELKAPTYQDNAAALAGGLAVGKSYWDLTGLFRKVIPGITLPVFTQTLGDLVAKTFYTGTTSERKWKAQSAAKSWSVNMTSAANTPVVRFETRPGDFWLTDSIDNNTHNGYYKERAEMYNINPTTNLGYNTPWDQTQWISYQMYIEPGGDVVFPNPVHYCDLGQWHAKSGAGQATIKIDFRNQDEITVYTHGDTTTAGNGTVRLPTTKLARGVWHSIVMEVKHSRNAAGGVFRMWINKAQVVNLTGIPLGIRAESDAGYWKFGIYKSPNDKGLGGEDDLRVNFAVQYAAMKISTTSLFDKVENPDPVAP